MAIKLFEAKDYTGYDSISINAMTSDQLTQLRRQLAKTANERMRSFEKQGIDRFAYGKAQAYLYMTGERRRFTERKSGLNLNQERKEVAEILKFLNAKTGTVGRVKQIYRTAYNTFKENQDVNISFGDYLYIMENNYISKSGIGSGQIINLVKSAISKGVEVKEFLTELNGRKEVTNIKDAKNLIDEMSNENLKPL